MRPQAAAHMREPLALLFLGRKVKSEILRYAHNDSMAGGNPRSS
jgi:hypothetical protein